jgi:hypothetical protein
MLTYAGTVRRKLAQQQVLSLLALLIKKVQILTQKALQYAAAAQVVRDVMLCFENAIKYNPPANAVHEQVC